MRRFEFVEGTSAKFWMGGVEGNTFVVVFGRLGTPGQRKEKAFPDDKGAQRELEKKIAEKLREGYHEVAADAGDAAPAGAKGAAAAAPKLALPARVRAAKPSGEQVKRAVAALASLEAEVGSRSWAVSHKARLARRALEKLGGYDPANDPTMAAVFDSLMALVTAPRGARRLPLRVALELLGELDVAAFERALARWKGVPAGAPAGAALATIASQREALGESELGLRVGALLCDRPEASGSSEAGWTRRWKTLAPHLEAYLAAKGTTVRKHFAAENSGDPRVARRLARVAG